MIKIKKGIVIFLICLIPGSVSFQSCDKIAPIIDALLQILDLTGWLFDDEEMDNIPEDITPFDDDTRTLETAVSLERFFPPIGDQGQYGTCVAWAVGYNLKTALNAIERGWTSADLSMTSNQTSPQDLWMIIPTKSRGSNCGGTNFEPALDAIISSGVASLSSVPYPTKVNCTGTTGGNANNKLANYRKIASEKQGLEVDNFKGYLNAGRPIAIGAKLGDLFMKWNNNSVISYDTYKNPGMQHAYHAMALVGYDDSKNAFRVRNSWGTGWGDKGSIWVDYDFFCESFCFAAFVAQNPTNVSMGTSPVTGDDLLALFADDYDYEPDEDDDDDDFNRTFEYVVYNSGTNDILPSRKWTATYMIYNAFNATDYQIIFDDYYTDEFSNIEGDNGYYDVKESLVGGWWNNVTLRKGESIGEDDIINYVLPHFDDGFYYLVLMADSYDVIREVNEDNNFFFITAENGKPLEIKNGVITNKPNRKASSIQRSSLVDKRPALFSNTENQTTVVPGNLNSYTPAEIKTMLLHEKKTGRLDVKRKAFHAGNNNNVKFEKKPRKQCYFDIK